MSASKEQEAVTTGRRLQDRERAILDALYDHEILLTAQIKVLFFTSTRRCQDQMQKLKQLGLVDKDDPSTPVGVGRQNRQWTLTESGIAVVAIGRGKPRSQLLRMPRHTWHASDKMLAHRLGVNRFFVSLVEASLGHSDHGFQKWNPEKYHTTMVAGAWIKPDGFGRYQHPGGACDFYLEFDRGTEWTRQLEKKLTGYVKVALLWAEGELDHFPNVLVVGPDVAREAAFEKALKNVLDDLEIPPTLAVKLPFFITGEDIVCEQGILGQIWRQFVPCPEERPLANLFLQQRLSIVELPAIKTGPYDLGKCLGRQWTDEKTRAHRRLKAMPPTYPSGEPPLMIVEPMVDPVAGPDGSEGGEAA